MNFGREKYTVTLVAVGLCFFSQVVIAALFEPGVGVGLEYTDNVTLVNEDTVDDLITAGYVGARLSEDKGALTYDATAAFNNHSYTQDTYPDQRYFTLGARVDWAMIKERFNWFSSNTFSQRTVNSLNSNTPDNLQDTNAFTFGAKLRFPVSARQNFTLVPQFNQYYYEVLSTDNKQYSLAANWNYQMFRLTSVGLNLSTRKINYTETDLLGRSIEDTTFTSLGFTFNGQRLRSSFSGNLGSTNVKRENGQETTGFSGYLNWLASLSSRSKLETLASTDLTDTSSVAYSLAGDPANGSNDVQITADVIRNSIINLAYLREDALLNTRIWARYHKIKYSDKPLDRIIRDFGLRFNHPVTQRLSSGAYINYNRTKQLDTNRLDKRFTVGGNLRYNFSRKLHGLLDLKYRKKESTDAGQNYDEYSAFVSLVYGFGDVRRPTRTGGF
jgi:hypothetical protein